MDLVVAPDGSVRAVYAEAIDLRLLGAARIARASHVEPDVDGRWRADLGPVSGPVLGPFAARSEALAAEAAWLAERWLGRSGEPQAPARCPDVCPVDRHREPPPEPPRVAGPPGGVARAGPGATPPRGTSP